MAGTTAATKVKTKQTAEHTGVVAVDAGHDIAADHCGVVGAQRDEGAASRPVAVGGRHDGCWAKMFVALFMLFKR